MEATEASELPWNPAAAQPSQSPEGASVLALFLRPLAANLARAPGALIAQSIGGVG